MNRRHENDPERDRNSRNTWTDEIGREEDLNPDQEYESDLARAQQEGNLGNERPRRRSPDEPGRNRSRS